MALSDLSPYTSCTRWTPVRQRRHCSPRGVPPRRGSRPSAEGLLRGGRRAIDEQVVGPGLIPVHGRGNAAAQAVMCATTLAQDLAASCGAGDIW